MAEFQDIFGPNGEYTADLDTEMEDGVTGCWVSKGDFTASLECLMATGVLEDHDNHDGSTHAVPQDVIDEIEQWALENGY